MVQQESPVTVVSRFAKIAGWALLTLAAASLVIGLTFPAIIDKGIAAFMMAGGLVRLALWLGSQKKTIWTLLAGLGWTMLGGWALATAQGLSAFSLVLMIGFLGEGLLKLVLLRIFGRLRGALACLVAADLALGVLLLIDWPRDMLWAIPALVAANLALSGMTILLAGRAIAQFQMPVGDEVRSVTVDA